MKLPLDWLPAVSEAVMTWPGVGIFALTGVANVTLMIPVFVAIVLTGDARADPSQVMITAPGTNQLPVIVIWEPTVPEAGAMVILGDIVRVASQKLPSWSVAITI